ncbi:unnamed protein product [Adineta steineri]|uniref:beta-N-acetylhexosaminidase n=1 Tax=Adineta steineri TaxID=433720 RepID=A0A819VMD2_9BILA|nr:unnamed protein product [Adineta steineri]
MFPIRRFGTFMSRISLTVILLSASLFFIFGFKKYLSQTDSQQYVPAGRNLIKKHIHDHHNHDHGHDQHDVIQQSQPIIRQEVVKLNIDPIESISSLEKRRLLQQNDSSATETTKIGQKTIAVYVHFDLKGAAPKLSYFEQLFPLIRKWGATGVCMEYEDMFPFDGIVSNITHKQAYTKNDIENINKLAKENHLEVMPLLQTYGHLEFLLKLEEFIDVRENPRYPQVITPCTNKTYPILFAMIDQYLSLHPDIRLFHIGHDEVYYFLTHPSCAEFQRVTGIRSQYDLFAYHLSIIAKYIQKKNPNIRLFIWHDVLQNLNMEMIHKYNLIDLINPVLWSYREDMTVEGFASPSQAALFGQYKSLWGASAYKGSTNEIATTSDVRHHYENQVSWIKQLKLYIPSTWANFDGIMITGWSRYDHFLSLCELLPYSIPSLAFSLAAWKEPFKSLPKMDIYENKELQKYVQNELQCSSAIHLTAQEHAIKPAPKCKFPGSKIYEALMSLPSLWAKVDEAEFFVDKYVTDLHIKFNYIHVKRGEECLDKLKPVVPLLKQFIDSFRKSMDEVFPPQVAIEWLETYFMKSYRSVIHRYEFIKRAVKEQKAWLPRPIPDNDTLEMNTKNKR